MARKLAGVTKDNKVYGTLESRFGMFLASNTQGARFTIQCIGLAETTHMELAGDTHSHDQTVDVLMDEMKSSDGALAAAEAVEDKALLRRSLEGDQGRHIVEAEKQQDRTGERNRRDQKPVYSTNNSSSRNLPTEGGLAQSGLTSSEGQEESVTNRWVKGAAKVKGAYRKYKPMVMAQVSSNNSSTSVNTLKGPPPSGGQNWASCRKTGTVTDSSDDESCLPPIARCESDDSVNQTEPQTSTHYEDRGDGSFPTVQISSRPGGHFDGTLRISHEEVKAQRRESKKKKKKKEEEEGGPGDGDEGHPRFLKLRAYNPSMKDNCFGVVNLIDPEGVSVISDIDDTIKETNVAAGAKVIFQNTFLREMQDVPGMADVYKRWWSHGAAIHYVSNSPWQLIPSLLEFFRSHKFPPGSAHLRLHDSMLKTYFMTPGDHKRRSIPEILKDFPHRKFILVGDSGEIDLEIYTELALEYPDQVFKIFIRDITTKRLEDAQEKAAAKAAKAAANSPNALTSLLPKAQLNAVANGFGLWGSRQNSEGGTSSSSSSSGSGMSTPGTTATARTTDDRSVNESNHSGYPFPRGKNGDTASIGSSTLVALDQQPDDVEKNEKGKKEDEKEQEEEVHLRSGQIPPGLGRPSPVAKALKRSDIDPSTEAAFEAAATLERAAETTDVAAEDDEPMPGAPPASAPEPPRVKTPLEVWLERVEQCRGRLPEGLLTFYEDASTLAEDALVSEMIRHHRWTSTWDDDGEDELEGEFDDDGNYGEDVDKDKDKGVVRDAATAIKKQISDA
ncbi:hypothetical protein BGZ54_003617 [Gamsiella multidivaricata]|nr:hypothetical protein BGZ54_003617 [Gamsiella multidivaricata]